MQNKYSDLIDNRNNNLWEELNNSFQIKFESSFEPNYIVNTKSDLITIYVDENNINPAPFTHELLHIYLRSKNINVSLDLLNKLRDPDFIDLILIFPQELVDHIGNCLEHNKMLPIFKKLGFKNHEFLTDNNQKKIDDNFMSQLEYSFRINNSYSIEAIEHYIAKYFAIKADNNKFHNYKKFHKKLIKLEKSLYKILSDFWNDWTIFDVEDPNDNYDEILEFFVDDLKEWSKNKTFE